jgi:tetratricopeptide (TPR) repeat protein
MMVIAAWLGSFCCFPYSIIFITMKFLPLLLLSSFLQLPVVALNQEPLISIVQQVDETQKARVNELIAEGDKLFNKSEYLAALDKWQQGLALAKKIGDKVGEVRTLNGIGGVYKSLGQYLKALEYFEQSLVISKAIEDKSGQGPILYNIGEVYKSLGQYLKAL